MGPKLTGIIKVNDWTSIQRPETQGGDPKNTRLSLN
jgi:hypothetical protein